MTTSISIKSHTSTAMHKRAGPTVSLFTSFAETKGAIGHHIRSALKTNLQLQLLDRLVVLTESDIEVIRETCGVADSRIEFVATPTRPTFHQIVSFANEQLESQVCDVAILANADMAFLTADDALRTVRLAKDLSNSRENVVLCLTRYDGDHEAPRITLKNRLTLPNTLSADVWAFAKPVRGTRELYYSPGQMFCDKFFAYDLIKAGYRVYNPCLDCRAFHHEKATKDVTFYRGLTNQDTSKQSLQKHIALSGSKGRYFGICHVTSRALLAGYDPAPMTIQESRRKLYVAISNALVNEGLREIVEHYHSLGKAFDVDVNFLVQDAPKHHSVEAILAELGAKSSYCLEVQSSARVLEKLLAGNDAHYSNAYCVNHAKGLSEALLNEFNTIFVSVSDQDPAIFQPHGKSFAGELSTAAKPDDVVYVCGLSEAVCAYLANQFFESGTMTIIWAQDYRFIRKFRERATPVCPRT